ncbi:MAG TPA: amidohydrolase family protein [Caulobacteraceae bacterium]|jgi:imidazolonepropionase-like amidohydrolase
MRRSVLVLALLACAATACAAPATLEELAKPPADATGFTIMSSAGVHGHSYQWVTPDGVHHGRESLNLRGQLFETDSATAMGPDGSISHMEIRGFTPSGDSAETFDVHGGVATWKSPVDGASAPYAGPAMYLAFGGPFDVNEIVADAVIASPDHRVRLLPGGELTAEPLTTLEVGDGAARKTIAAWAITGFGGTPTPVWFDDKGKLFAIDAGLTWIRPGYEAAQPLIDKAQDQAMGKRSAAIAHRFLQKTEGPVAFTHVRAFLDGDRFADDQTVVVNKGIITKIGGANGTSVPPGARIIDGHGDTLVPGLWDSHQHVGDDFSGPTLLSLGVTSVRDPGNVTALTLSRAARRASGDLLMPHVYPSMLMDGKGPYTAQVGEVSTSLDEALGIVRKAKSEGFVAVKFYGSFNPAWVAPTAALAHQLGMHVHGHIPAGMRTMDAINAGYDEITHIYFVAMQAMPDDVVAKSNTIARMEGPAKYAKGMDLSADPMKSLIATMASKHITSDPTLVVVESLMVPENGDLGAAYAPFLGTLPPTVERGFRAGGLAVAPGYTRADYRASFRKLEDLVGAMHEAGVQIVAGTDGSGLELVRELELYVDSGFTPSEALQAATLAPARLQHADDHTGIIAPGKNADLLLVSGDPSKNIGDLRHSRMVMMDGALMNCDELRGVAGIAGRPKYSD